MGEKTVVITGASTGIGRASTEYLIDKGFHVFATLRKTTDAERLMQAFGEKVTPLIFDVTDESGITEAAEKVKAHLQLQPHHQKLAGLVNNAGIAVEGPLLDLDADTLRHQLEVNLISIHNIVQAFSPLLGTDNSLNGPAGRIINISSTSGKHGMPFIAPYVASKHALEGYSECLRRELLIYGIDVIIVAPGNVRTPIWDKSEEKGTTGFEESEYYPYLENFKKIVLSGGRKGLDPSVIAKTIWTALTVNNPKVRYAPVPQKFLNWTIPNLMPKRMLDRLVAREIGFKNKIKHHQDA